MAYASQCGVIIERCGGQDGVPIISLSSLWWPHAHKPVLGELYSIQ